MGYCELQGSGEVISRRFGHNQLTQHPGPFPQLYERYTASVPHPIVRMTGGRFLGVWTQERQGDGVTSVGMWAQVNKSFPEPPVHYPTGITTMSEPEHRQSPQFTLVAWQRLLGSLCAPTSLHTLGI